MTSRIRATHVALAIPAVAFALVIYALVPPASAGHSANADRRAVDLLTRAMTTPATVSYSGTKYVAAWSALDPAASTSAMVDVTHTAGGDTLVRAHGAEPMSVLDRPSTAAWLAEGGGPVGLLSAAYDVAVTGTADVAGRAAYVVEARRADGSTAARLWLDQEVALPLRREVYDDAGATLAASGFVEFELTAVGAGRGPGPQRHSGGTAQWTFGATQDQQLGHGDLAELRERGWACPPKLANGLLLYEARRVGDAVQLSYSDGVATLSVFEQPGQLDPAVLAGFIDYDVDDGVVYRAPGPPSQFIWSTGDQVVTVITDSPSATVEAVFDALPPEPAKSPGLLGRIGRGAERLASWINPFG